MQEQQRNDIFARRVSRREVLAAFGRVGAGGALASLAGLGAGLGLSGCGGGDGNGSDVAANRTGRFYSATQFALVGDVGIDIGRTFVELLNGVPVEMGWELPERALNGLPDFDFDEPGIYFLPFPAEADATPFKFMAFSDWSAHKPVGTGDVPHVHPVVCIAPPQAPSEGNVKETAPVTNPDEIPEGYVLGSLIPGAGETIAPGIGDAFEYPEAPQLTPGWNTTAQNYFFYDGHLNGIGMGATYEFLATKQTAVLPVTQPKLYPKPGYYPTKNVTRWNEANKAHVFALTDFVQAMRWI
jgi:hypothetical protein